MDHLTGDERALYHQLKRAHPSFNEQQLLFHLKLATGEITGDILRYNLETHEFDDPVG